MSLRADCHVHELRDCHHDVDEDYGYTCEGHDRHGHDGRHAGDMWPAEAGTMMHADVQEYVPGLNARAAIRMAFEARQDRTGRIRRKSPTRRYFGHA